jgi:hypothetical protein
MSTTADPFLPLAPKVFHVLAWAGGGGSWSAHLPG